MAVGVVVEYNPFHNGHLHHLNEVKKKFPNTPIIGIMSGNFMQRGEPAIIDKWTRTEIALNYGIDLMIELPYIYATSHADLFARGAIKLLNECQVDHIVFGSEQNDIELLKKSAQIQLQNKDYDDDVKKYLDQGLNYPTAMSKALSDILGHHYDTPNDLLGLSYVKEIMMHNYKITPHTIKRTNSYHDIDFDTTIASATSVRLAKKENKPFDFQVPELTHTKMQEKKCVYKEDFFSYIQYKIMSSSIEDLKNIHGMEEGIEYKLKKEVLKHADYESFMQGIKSKRYTYNRIQRLLTNVLLNVTKQNAKNLFNLDYIRILGFTKEGQLYLNKIKNQTTIPFCSRFKEGSNQLDMELRATSIYTLALNDSDRLTLIDQEIKSIPLRI